MGAPPMLSTASTLYPHNERALLNPMSPMLVAWCASELGQPFTRADSPCVGNEQIRTLEVAVNDVLVVHVRHLFRRQREETS